MAGCLFVLSSLVILITRSPFPLIVGVAGLLGHLGGRYAPDKFAVGGAHGKTGKALGPAVIDDDHPHPRV